MRLSGAEGGGERLIYGLVIEPEDLEGWDGVQLTMYRRSGLEQTRMVLEPGEVLAGDFAAGLDPITAVFAVSVSSTRSKGLVKRLDLPVNK